MAERDHTEEAKRLAAELVDLLESRGWPAPLALAGLAMACAAWTEQHRLAARERAELPAEKVN